MNKWGSINIHHEYLTMRIWTIINAKFNTDKSSLIWRPDDSYPNNIFNS
jgi:hypothetical protein